MTDWLGDAEEEFLPARIEQEQIRKDLAVAILADVKKDLAPPAVTGKSSEQLLLAWVKLKQNQQVFLETLKRCMFNGRAAERLLARTDEPVSRSSHQQWLRDNAEYRFVYDVMRSVASKNAISRESVILRAAEVAEEAMEPVPILYHGQPTGFFENQKDTALRANEQLAKLGGHMKGDDKSDRVVVHLVNLAGPEVVEQPPAVDAEFSEVP